MAKHEAAAKLRCGSGEGGETPARLWRRWNCAGAGADDARLWGRFVLEVENGTDRRRSGSGGIELQKLVMLKEIHG